MFLAMINKISFQWKLCILLQTVKALTINDGFFNHRFILIFNLLFICKILIKNLTQSFQVLNNCVIKCLSYFNPFFFLKSLIVGKQSNSLKLMYIAQNWIFFLKVGHFSWAVNTFSCLPWRVKLNFNLLNL